MAKKLHGAAAKAHAGAMKKGGPKASKGMPPWLHKKVTGKKKK